MSQDRARSIVQLAASKTKNSMVRNWLSMDERGVWELVARSILLAKSRDAKSKKKSEDVIDSEVAEELIDRIVNYLQLKQEACKE